MPFTLGNVITGADAAYTTFGPVVDINHACRSALNRLQLSNVVLSERIPDNTGVQQNGQESCSKAPLYFRTLL